MNVAKIKYSAEYLRAFFLGPLDAQFVGAEWDEKTRSVILTVQGPDVPEATGLLLRVEIIKSETVKFAPAWVDGKLRDPR